MSDAFAPKGDRAEWRLIYDKLLSHADFGDVITYAELSEVLDRDFLSDRGPIYKARRHLATARRRWVEVVPGVGYRVIHANEHGKMAERRVKFGERQFQEGTRISAGTDLSRLTKAELAEYDRRQLALNGLARVTASARRQLKRENILQARGLV